MLQDQGCVCVCVWQILCTRIYEQTWINIHSWYLVIHVESTSSILNLFCLFVNNCTSWSVKQLVLFQSTDLFHLVRWLVIIILLLGISRWLVSGWREFSQLINSSSTRPHELRLIARHSHCDSMIQYPPIKKAHFRLKSLTWKLPPAWCWSHSRCSWRVPETPQCPCN